MFYPSEHPRPDFARDCFLSLDGEWDFAFDDENVGIKDQWFMDEAFFDRRIVVPFCYQCEKSGISVNERHDVIWYRRTFTVPNEMCRMGSVLLHFGAVDYACEVYVNTFKVGEHTGGYTPFALDITDYISAGENDLCLRVVDRPDCTQPRGKQSWTGEAFGVFYTPTSGIWQSVWLEGAGAAYLTRIHITPDLTNGAARFDLSVNSEAHFPITAKIRVSFEGKTIAQQSVEMLRQSAHTTVDLLSEGSQFDLHLWHPDHPNLYDVEVSLSGGDCVHTYFGMRSVELRNGAVLLNGTPIYQRLVLDQGYWPESLLTPPDGDAIRADLEWIKRLGFNGVRKHQKIEDPRFYYWASRLGVLVWGELPAPFLFGPDTVANLSATLSAFIERDYNHPSIITWVPLNESWGVDQVNKNKKMQAAAQMLYYQAKALDGTRLVSTNDGWENLCTDVFGLHDYPPDGYSLLSHFMDPERVRKVGNDWRVAVCEGHALRGDEAFLLTEFGGIAFDDGSDKNWGYHDKVADEEDFFARCEPLFEAIHDLANCEGYCYTQLTDVQQEANGLLTEAREPKIDPDRFAALNTNPPGRIH